MLNVAATRHVHTELEKFANYRDVPPSADIKANVMPSIPWYDECESDQAQHQKLVTGLLVAMLVFGHRIK
jgi:hypothetical protein